MSHFYTDLIQNFRISELFGNDEVANTIRLILQTFENTPVTYVTLTSTMVLTSNEGDSTFHIQTCY